MNYTVIAIVLALVLITLSYVFLMFYRIRKQKIAEPRVLEITTYIKDGAMAFLKREYIVMVPFIVFFALLLLVLGFIPATKSAEGVGWQGSICFLVGALFSGLAGFLGMQAATMANGRTTIAAKKDGMGGALKIAFAGGSILGLTVSALGLLGIIALFLIFESTFGLSASITMISGYGLGCSMIALFGRVGGGIYTKAADVGADLVGKIESGIPEDDPRNPAVIADNVGDNVGDIAGMGSDLTESYVGSIVSSLALALVTATYSGILNEAEGFKNIFYVLIIAGIGLGASLLASILMRFFKKLKPNIALNLLTYLAAGVVAIGALFLSLFYLKAIGSFVAILAGLFAGIALGVIANYYTSSKFKPVKEIAQESTTGHATNIIAGFGSGMQSTLLTIVVLIIGIVVSFFAYGQFGISLAAVGMLSTVGITVAVDGYGPIADNAGGIAEMSNQDESVREITDELDAVGNTTAAIGKGFCIGSATMTSLSLIVAFSSSAGLKVIDIIQPQVIIGLLFGAMLPYFFASLTIKSVGKAANKMILEVRRQFKADPGIMEGTSLPDYKKCVDISTKAALKEMILPGVIAIFSPILVSLVLGVAPLGGMLIGGLASSIMLAVFMANSGGAWDNAKKYIEQGNQGGKGSPAHEAAITGDTVGDPFKDTAGPAMDILIKLMSIISLILAPVLTNGNFTSLFDLITKALGN